MGAADVVPGVSGGTMAFILGIYEELIQAIRAFDLQFVRLLASFKVKDALEDTPWKFLLAVGLGILTAIFSLAGIITWLLNNQPVLIWSFFFGLILASAVMVGKRFKERTPTALLWIFLGGIGAYAVVGLVPLSTPNAPWFLFLSGAIAICAMILPGISGSFILVLLGKYQYVLGAVNNRDFFTLAIVALGAAVGLILFSRLLSWLLKKHHDPAIAILCGLMIGSLRKVWPWKRLDAIIDAQGRVIASAGTNILPAQWNLEVTLALALVIVGVIAVLSLEWLAAKNE